MPFLKREHTTPRASHPASVVCPTPHPSRAPLVGRPLSRPSPTHRLSASGPRPPPGGRRVLHRHREARAVSHAMTQIDNI
eukprot:scaffold3038_cov69-Phaeocystis_antarctica.AAC.3